MQVLMAPRKSHYEMEVSTMLRNRMLIFLLVCLAGSAGQVHASGGEGFWKLANSGPDKQSLQSCNNGVRLSDGSLEATGRVNAGVMKTRATWDKPPAQLSVNQIIPMTVTLTMLENRKPLFWHHGTNVRIHPGKPWAFNESDWPRIDHSNPVGTTRRKTNTILDAYAAGKTGDTMQLEVHNNTSATGCNPVYRYTYIWVNGAPSHSTKHPSSETGSGTEANNLGNWHSVGTGDCPGRDVASSTGPYPDPAKCNDAVRGQTAVCWDRNCTYKNIQTGSCTGGVNPGRMYTCKPVGHTGTVDSGRVITSKPGKEMVLFYNGNDGGVSSGGRSPRFSVDRPVRITSMFTYHNGYRGIPGKIRIIRSSGSLIGSWDARGRSESPQPSWYWEISPDVELQPGTYLVETSNPGSWSQNSGSGGNGMVQIKGVYLNH
jgi:hypothetical protein